MENLNYLFFNHLSNLLILKDNNIQDSINSIYKELNIHMYKLNTHASSFKNTFKNDPIKNLLHNPIISKIKEVTSLVANLYLQQNAPKPPQQNTLDLNFLYVDDSMQQATNHDYQLYSCVKNNFTKIHTSFFDIIQILQKAYKKLTSDDRYIEATKPI